MSELTRRQIAGPWTITLSCGHDNHATGNPGMSPRRCRACGQESKPVVAWHGGEWMLIDDIVAARRERRRKRAAVN